MIRQSLYFAAPGRVEVQTEETPAGGPGEVLVQSILSGISPGTEMLIYRGEAPAGLAADSTISALAGGLEFPLKYGYSLVGRVIAVGAEADPFWLDRLVFAFHPHESHFWSSPALLQLLPAGVEPEDAIFLPTIETAINFVQDGSPLIGEQVIVFGQGVVGLLTTTLLARLSLAQLITLDGFPLRRQFSLAWGAHDSLDPADPAAAARLNTLLAPHAADLVYELSGAPAALDQAIAATGFGGRVVIGSWYGSKRACLDLGGAFHRSRIRLISSQVSTLAPELTGRWDKARRLHLAWRMVAELHPSRLLTHTFPFAQASQAYALLHNHPAETIQTALRYE